MRRKATTSDMMKSYLVESLFQLMEKKPFAEITIIEIAVRAGVNRSTYYRHFRRKEEIVQCYIDELMSEFIDSIDRNMDLECYLSSLFNHFNNHKHDLLILYDNGLAEILLDVLNKKFGGMSNENVKNLSERYGIAYHVGGVYNHLRLWFSRRMEDSPEELARVSAGIFPKEFTPYLLRRSEDKSSLPK